MLWDDEAWDASKADSIRSPLPLPFQAWDARHRKGAHPHNISPLSTIGHVGRSRAGICWSEKSRFSFSGERLCSGQKRSPGCQLRTVSSGPSDSASSKPPVALSSRAEASGTITVRRVSPISGMYTSPGMRRRYSYPGDCFQGGIQSFQGQAFAFARGLPSAGQVGL